MHKFIITLGLMVIFGISISAQSTSDYHKAEFYAGYVNNQVEDGRAILKPSGNFSKVRESFNGFEISGVGNISRYIGIKGDFSAAYRNKEDSRAVYNFLGGVQLKDNSKTGSRIRPFGHLLAGAATTKFKFDTVSQPLCNQPNIVCNNTNIRRTGFSAVLGGGLDIRVSRRVSVRAIQIDYNPIHPDTNTQDNFRIGFGVVFR